MGWKRRKHEPKQSVSSVKSMSFLADQNLSFHRFSDGTISCEGKNIENKSQIWTTSSPLDFSTATDTTLVAAVDESAHQQTTTIKIQPPSDESKRSSSYSVTCSNSNESRQSLQNGSTLKLIQLNNKEDSSNKESRCSIFRVTILCLCLNLTYANIVRFPRELERHGVAFLVPYLIMMILVGLPIVLLEMALGQFLGQGSSHSWKSSPFFKGASIIGRLGAWLGCIWISMHMSLALLYIGQLSFSNVPFAKCPSGIQQNYIDPAYEEVPVVGQSCLQKTFLRPVSEYSLSFGLLAIGLVFLWVIIMMCTHSNRVNRRSLIMFGMAALGLLLFQTGWQISNTLQNEVLFPQAWPFQFEILKHSSTWFYALLQVILSTQIGIGALPVITGKFLYKGDVIRMCSLYMCFNFLVTIVATAYYMTTFGQHNTSATNEQPYPDLTTITSIYDRAFVEPHSSHLRSLIPSLAYLMIIFAGIVSISTAIYTSSRLLKRHPSYVMCLVAMFTSIAFLLYPNFFLSRMLDMRWTGLVIICALIFDIISITWVYGTKSLAIDLEFSLGRPIMKGWLVLWSCVPLILTAILAFFIVNPFPATFALDPIKDLIPKWIPIVICLCIIIFFAIHETTKQVDYNTCNMIYEATKSAKDWGPADPLVRHAWKQWKAVCDDTGQRDFTLRRRGTKDWTSSIKKGQYSNAQRNNSTASNKLYAINNKQLTPTSTAAPASTITNGSNSPNYSGSLFGDSAIEEDIGYDKYSPTNTEPYESRGRLNRQFSDVSSNNNRYFHQKQQQQTHQQQQQCDDEELNGYQKIPIRISNGKQFRDDQNFGSRIEIIPFDIPPPPAQFQAQSTFMTQQQQQQNPLCHLQDLHHHHHNRHENKFMGSHHALDFIHQQQRAAAYHQQGSSEFLHSRNTYSDGTGSVSTKTTTTTTTTTIPRNNNNWRQLNDEFSTEL